MAEPTSKPNRKKATRWQDSHRNHILIVLLTLTFLLAACSPATAPTIKATVQGALPTPIPEPTLTPSPLPTATPLPGLSGHILDQATGQPITGATVSAGNYTTTTDADGRYTLPDLPPGQYVLSVTHEGYDPALSAILTLGQDRAVTTDLELYAAGTTPYPQDPMLTNPLDPNGAPTAEEAERLARLQGLTGEVVSIEETKLRGQFLVNYRIGDDIRAAVAELKHEVWELTDDAGQKWWIVKVCGNRASRLPAEASIATPEPRPLPPLAEVMVDTLSVRACASETCDEVGTMQRGMRVEALGCLADGSWCQVGLPDGGSGWCTGPSLRQLAVAEAVPVLEAGGGKIAFLSDRDREPGRVDIYLMNPDGSGQTRVTTGLKLAGFVGDHLSGLDEYFDWSAAHQKFFYSWNELYSVNADGNEETLVAEKVHQFDLSPDGRHIAFYIIARPSIDSDIAIMNADGTGRTILTDQATCDSLGLEPDHHTFLGPAWSPDGSKIAFYASGILALMNADGSNPVRLIPSDIGVYEPFSWSPDGQYLTFQIESNSRVIDLHVLDLHNDRTSRLIEDGRDPTWSPDGRQIAFYRSDEQIWVMNADGTGLTQLTFEGRNCCPVWVRSSIPMPTPPPSPAAMATVEPVSTLPAKPTRPVTPAAVPSPKRLTFYYFYAKWCDYSQQMTPIMKQLEANYKDRMDFTWLNVDKTSSDYWCYKYGIRSVPAYVISDLQGNAVKVWVGAKPESVLAQGIETVLASTGGGQAHPGTPPNCPNEHARITYPGMNETVSGVVHFRGSADIPNFEYYKFEFRPSGALQWQYLTRKDKPVSDGDLIEWWTNTIEPGVYEVRLIVVDKTGNYPEPCTVTVNVVR